ncbi:BTAD domain-containing putative transcriptional regulator [Agromyces sp. LHK192]|uniref:AfsR/SARP family transcriptional regulator n=1 Tax=Agromyces sp. LHK192 TaxID=2498704 RepID=UPI0013E35F43|nr:BTAD domain-containing putative transcriptional regulator [Agromyces sp. LHK192]
MRVLRPSVDLTARPQRERIILAALIAARGKAVSIGELVDLLWGEDPPATAINQVQRHVGELRRLLEPDLPARAAGTAVLGTGAGYRIDTGVVATDLEQVAGLWADSRQRSPEDAAIGYLTALELAAGAAFGGLGWETLSFPAFQSIERDRIALAIDAAECALSLRDPGPLATLISNVADDAPLNEALRAKLITLLSRCGRRAEAIAIYDATRRRLWEELTIAPGVELQAAVDEILADEPTADSSMAPRGLPLAPAATVDRAGVQDLLDEATESAARGESAVLLISGMAGIGKTTLALQWAHAIADRFPDGQLFVNLSGYAPPGESVTETDALREWLADLGGSVAGIQGGVAALRDAYRRAMAGRRMVIIIDNAADVDHVRSLLPGAPGCLVIVTSRAVMPGLLVQDGAIPVPLRRLTVEESRRLLARRLGEARVQADTAAIESIVASCAGLPLALALAAASASGSREAMHEVVDGLSAAASALDVLALDAKNDLRSAFDWSYRSLSDDAATLFRLSSVHPGTTHPRAALASIAGFDLRRTAAAASELVAANMFVTVATGEYAVHDLLRLYGREMTEGTPERDAARRRSVSHYVHTARNAYLAFGRPPVVEVASPPPIAEAIATFASPDDATRWFLAERKAIIETFGIALSLGLDREAALIALDWRPMRQTVDAPSTMIEEIRRATDAASRSGDERLEVELRRDLAVNLGLCGQDDESQEHFARVLERYRSWGDDVGESNTLRNLAYLATEFTGRLDLSRKSVEAARRSERSDILSIALVSYAVALLIDGDLEQLDDVTAEAAFHIETSGAEYLAPYVSAYRAMLSARRGQFDEALALIATIDGSLDVMIQAYSAMITTIAEAGANRRESAHAARERFERIVHDHTEFLSNDFEGTIMRPWIDEAIAAMETRLRSVTEPGPSVGSATR